MKVFWFSFSFKGKNNGVCLIEAETADNAKDKMEKLNLIPDYDDVLSFEMDDMSDESALLSFNRLYSPEEMAELGYDTIS